MGTPVKTRAGSHKGKGTRSPRKTRVTLTDRYRRAERIMVARHRSPPVTWEKIAAREGISVRWAHRLYDMFAEEGEDTAGRRPGQEIDRALKLWRLTLDELLEIADEARAEGAYSAAVAALGKAIDTSAMSLALQRAAGRLPMDLQQIDAPEDSRRMFDAMVEVLRDADLPDEVIARLEGIAAGEDGPRVIDGTVAGGE